MKQLTFDDKTFEAEKIVKYDDAIIGTSDGVEQFSFTGVRDFTAFTLAEGQTYDPAPEPVEPPAQKLDRIEQQMQTDSMATFDVLANLYSEVAMGGLSQMEVMAVMYEELITLRAEVEALKGGAV